MQNSFKAVSHKSPATNQWFARSPIVFVIYVSLTSFIIYASMYGFRKPFTSATYDGFKFMGISYKVCLVIAQTIGYTLSKFYGIRFIGTMKPENRAKTILMVIGVAWLSLLLFAIVPKPYNILCMFFNGLPLGVVWGLVFGYLEGRKVTELLGAVMATSFIFGSGLAKTVGKWLMGGLGISQWWMPFAAGGIFLVPLVICVWLINQTPPPNPADVVMRTKRKPMTKEERKGFISRFGLALVPIITTYALLTIVRDFSEDFANELWIETGNQNNAYLFAQNSTCTSIIVLVLIGGFFLFKNNYMAFQFTYKVIIFGLLLAVTSTYLYQIHLISPIYWMLFATSGLYLGYVPYHCFYFERLLAAFKVEGNVGFLMYIADAFGYLGTLIVLLIKELMTVKYNWVNFFSFLFYVSAAIGFVLVLISARLFDNIHRKQEINLANE